MNNEEAKFILQGYRPSGADAGDATFAAALKQARNDPTLGEWFARQQAFDAAIGAKLAQVAPPAGLRAAILAGGRASAAAGPRRDWWSHPLWMAAASLAVLLAAGLALWPKQASAFDDFAYADARLSAMHGHESHGTESSALQLMLGQTTTRLGQKLPVNFVTLHDTGCRHVSYRGLDVLEVCFNRNGEWFHCYIGRAVDFPDMAAGVTPVIVEKGGGAVVSWTDGEHVIVVVSKVGRQSLEALL